VSFTPSPFGENPSGIKKSFGTSVTAVSGYFFYLQSFISLIKFVISGLLIFAFMELFNAISAYFCAFGQSFCIFIINPRFK
ncbi:hypothetical protein AB9T88_10535, partial [Flavobacterium sp. LBUM151]